jgi:hypothetical protein
MGKGGHFSSISGIPQLGLCRPIVKDVLTATPPQKCVFIANPTLETNIRRASDMEISFFTRANLQKLDEIDFQGFGEIKKVARGADCLKL